MPEEDYMETSEESSLTLLELASTLKGYVSALNNPIFKPDEFGYQKVSRDYVIGLTAHVDELYELACRMEGYINGCNI